MENVLIDDRRIHVDFSQSVAKLWNSWRRGDRNLANQPVPEEPGRRKMELKPQHQGSEFSYVKGNGAQKGGLVKQERVKEEQSKPRGGGRDESHRHRDDHGDPKRRRL